MRKFKEKTLSANRNYSACTGTLLTILFIVVTVQCKQNQNEIILQREWVANSEFAGDLCAAEIAKKNKYRLIVREGSEALDPIRQVKSGDAHFGVASADRILHENENGANLRIIACATSKSPVVYLSKTDAKIAGPKDFKGKKIGIQSGTNTELILYAMLLKNSISPDDVKIVESGWGVQGFVTDDIDVLGVFEYDEPIQLDSMNIKYAKIYPEENGVQFVGTVYFTSQELILKHPALVQKFVDFLVEGWTQALENSNVAMKLVYEFAKNIDKEKETKSFAAGKKYFSGENGKLLYSSRERWGEMASMLMILNKLKRFDFNESINYTFLENSLIKQ